MKVDKDTYYTLLKQEKEDPHYPMYYYIEKYLHFQNFNNGKQHEDSWIAEQRQK